MKDLSIINCSTLRMSVIFQFLSPFILPNASSAQKILSQHTMISKVFRGIYPKAWTVCPDSLIPGSVEKEGG